MISISDGDSLSRALELAFSPQIKKLLLDRQQQLGGDIAGQARFYIVQAGDRPRQLEFDLGFSIFQNIGDGSWYGDPDFTPGWEWLTDHGSFFEMVFILDDSGFAHVVLIEKAPGVDATLLELCRTYAPEHP